MPSINPEKCYLIAKEKPKILIHDIPSDWLTQLTDLCGEALTLSAAEKEAFMQRLQFHVGPEAPYTLKTSLLEELQDIWFRLSSEGAYRVDGSQRLAIALKIKEGIEHCTAGFHDRVREIVRPFYVGEDLAGLLYEERYELVNRAAHILTSEVHAHNRFFTIANVMGYGVNPLNKQDVYRGALDDKKIEKALEDTFAKEYTPFIILNRLMERIKGHLHVQYGYVGRKEPIAQVDTGKQSFYLAYNSRECGEFNRYLQEILAPFWTGEEYLLDEETSSIVDLDWKAIKKHLFNKLVAENYISCSSSEKNVIDSLLEEEENAHLTVFVSTSIRSPEELCHLIHFLHYRNTDVPLRLIELYLNTLTPEKKIEALWVFITAPEFNRELIHRLKTHFQRDLEVSNDRLSTLLWDALKDSKEARVSFLLNYLQKLNPEEITTILSCQSLSWQGSSILMYLMKSSQPIESIFALLSILPKDLQKQLLLQMDIHKDNVLLIAFWRRQAAVKPLFDLMEGFEQKDMINILLQQDNEGRNALMTAVYYTPQTLGVLFDKIASLPLDAQEQILTQKDTRGRNFLECAIEHNSSALNSILDRVGTLPLSLQEKILNVSSQNGFNMLHVAAHYKPSSLGKIIDIVKAFPIEQQLTILTPATIEKVLSSGNTSQAKAILDLVAQFSPKKQAEIFASKGENILKAVIWYHSALAEQAIGFFQFLPTEKQVQILNHVHEGRGTVLMEAVYNPTIPAEPFLNAIEQLSPQQQFLILSKKNHYSNIVWIAAARRPEIISPLMEIITHLPTEQVKDILTEGNAATKNIFWGLRGSAEINSVLYVIKNHCSQKEFADIYPFDELAAFLIHNQWISASAPKDPELIAMMLNHALLKGYGRELKEFLTQIDKLPKEVQNKILAHVNLDYSSNFTSFAKERFTKMYDSLNGWDRVGMFIWMCLFVLPMLIFVIVSAIDFFKEKNAINEMKLKIAETNNSFATSYAAMNATGLEANEIPEPSLSQENEPPHSFSSLFASSAPKQHEVHEDNKPKIY